MCVHDLLFWWHTHNEILPLCHSKRWINIQEASSPKHKQLQCREHPCRITYLTMTQVSSMVTSSWFKNDFHGQQHLGEDVDKYKTCVRWMAFDWICYVDLIGGRGGGGGGNFWLDFRSQGSIFGSGSVAKGIFFFSKFWPNSSIFSKQMAKFGPNLTNFA